jgi:hypothetical protein
MRLVRGSATSSDLPRARILQGTFVADGNGAIDKLHCSADREGEGSHATARAYFSEVPRIHSPPHRLLDC